MDLREKRTDDLLLHVQTFYHGTTESDVSIISVRQCNDWQQYISKNIFDWFLIFAIVLFSTLSTGLIHAHVQTVALLQSPRQLVDNNNYE